MLSKRYTYLLFFIAYIGSLTIEKPVYTVSGFEGCFSYLFTIIIHFTIFASMIWGNNALLIPYLLENKRFSLYGLGLIILIILYSFVINNYNHFIHDVVLHDPIIRTSSDFWANFVYGLCCAVIVSMLYITQKWSEQQEQVKNIKINHLQTELKYLRSQINPHFLFNGLNTVYGNIDSTNVQARNIMVQFSDLLRYNLYEADIDFIELPKEIKYLQNYVALQKARSNDNIQIELRVNCPDNSVKVAPLIFMAFVENAFKYATRDDSRINTICIKLNQRGNQINFECENSFDEIEPVAGGIGLNNAIRRLELLYKDRYKLDIKKENNIYFVHLTLTV